MADPPATRDEQRNRLLVNAATKPLNLAVGVLVLVVAGGAVGAVGLLVGLLVYVALAARTFFDDDETAKVLGKAPAASAGSLRGGKRGIPAAAGPARLDPAELPEHLAVHIRTARKTEASVHEALAQSDGVYANLNGEITALVLELEKTARKAKTVDGYVRSQDPGVLQRRLNEQRQVAPSAPETADLAEQLKSLYRLQRRVEDYNADLARLTAQLSSVASRIVEVALVGDESETEDLTRQARGLREQVEELSQLLT